MLQNKMTHFSQPGSAWSFRVIGHYALIPYFQVGNQQTVAGWNVYDGLWVPGSSEPGELISLADIDADNTSLHDLTREIDEMVTREIQKVRN